MSSKRACSMPMTSMLPPLLACIAIFRSAKAEMRTLTRGSTLLPQACTCCLFEI